MKNPKLVETKDWYEFHFPNGFIYDISKLEIRLESDQAYWLEHLSHKNWFNSELRKEFEEALSRQPDYD